MWRVSTQYQVLSEDLIRDFKNRVDWFHISHSQQLSEDFIREFADLIHWPELICNDNISIDVILALEDQVDWEAVMVYYDYYGFVPDIEQKIGPLLDAHIQRQEASEHEISEDQDCDLER